MNGQAWENTKYGSWDEAFRGLAPVLRQQSVRVADYTRALFVAAVAVGFCAETRAGAERIRGEYAELAYKCGIYHQIGKALVAPEYQIYKESFTEEEKAVYRKYTTDGRLLVASLQEKGTKVKEKRRNAAGEIPTANIPFLMLRECCEQHMERYNGEGYPGGLKGNHISPIAQLVGLAKELDRLASETASEAPFDYAINTLKQGVGKDWSAQLLSVLSSAEKECREIYTKYIQYTKTLPATVPLVEKTAERPMGLGYRPMVSDVYGTVTMYEAIPWFGGLLGESGTTETVVDVRELLVRTSLVESVSWYFLYEAADALLRIQNCRLDLQGIVLEMIPEFYTLKTQLQRFKQLFVDQPVEKERLWLTVPAQLLETATKTTLEIIRRYTRFGVRLLVDGYRPAQLDTAVLKELGICGVRLSPELYFSRDTAKRIRALAADGFTVFGRADSADALTWLAACEVACSSGAATGEPRDEDGMIAGALAPTSGNR